MTHSGKSSVVKPDDSTDKNITYFRDMPELLKRLRASIPTESEKVLATEKWEDIGESDAETSYKESCTILNEIGKSILKEIDSGNEIIVDEKLLFGYVISTINPNDLSLLFEGEIHYPRHHIEEEIESKDILRIADWIAIKSSEEKSMLDFELVRKITSNFCRTVISLDSSTDVPNLIRKLVHYEPLIYLTKERYRDHLFHAFQVTFLGDYLLFQKKLIWDIYPKADQEKLKSLRKEWILTGLLHDIGYAVQTGIFLWDRITEEFFTEDISNSLFEIRNKCGSHGEMASQFIKKLEGEPESVINNIKESIISHDDPKKELDGSKYPLSFLLVILDECQEWSRPFIDSQTYAENFYKETPISIFKIKGTDIHNISIKFEEKSKENHWTEIQVSYPSEYLTEENDFQIINIIYSKCINFSRISNIPNELNPRFKFYLKGIRGELEKLSIIANKHGYFQFGEWLKRLTLNSDSEDDIILNLQNKTDWAPIGIGRKTIKECIDLYKEMDDYKGVSEGFA